MLLPTRVRRNPDAITGIIFAWTGIWEMAMDWRSEAVHIEAVRPTPQDEFAYAAGWTISGVAMLCAIVAVWMFGI